MKRKVAMPQPNAWMRGRLLRGGFIGETPGVCELPIVGEVGFAVVAAGACEMREGAAPGGLATALSINGGGIGGPSGR
jgi:hypothetical protein